MATKRNERPSLGSTLKKKIELGKPEKEIDTLEEQVKALHSSENSTKSVVEDSTPEVTENSSIRTTIFVPKDLYKSIKIYCAHQDTLKIKDFVTEAIVEKCNRLKLIE